MHGYAVHTDLNGVSCRPINWTVCEVKLNGLDWMNGRSETQETCNTEKYLLYAHFKLRLCMGFFCNLQHNVFFCSIHLLVQHIKQLVEYILAEGVSRLCWLILGHGGEEWALSPGQTRWRVPESARRQSQPPSFSFYNNLIQISNTYITVGMYF